jgi:hypothetical protein
MRFLFLLMSLLLSCLPATTMAQKAKTAAQLTAEKIAHIKSAPGQPFTCPYCDLREAQFAGKNLTNANFLHANLRGANFSGANVRGAQFAQADLTGANFQNVTLGTAGLGPTDFTQAILTGANFRSVKIETSVSFQYAELTKTDFTGIDGRKARFGPQLGFDPGAGAPKFAGATLDCSFSLYWKYLDVTGAHLATCPAQPAAPANVQGTMTPPVPGKAPAAGPEGKPIPADGQRLEFLPQPEKPVDAARSAAGAANQVFVATTGTDGPNCGTTSGNACLTIGQGVTNCVKVGVPCGVLIGYGTYQLTATLQLSNNVSLVGGYISGAPSTYQSNVLAPAGGSPALTGNGVTLSLQNLVLSGSVSSSATQASVVVQLTGSSNVTAQTVNINAASGVNAGPSGAGASSAGGAGGNFQSYGAAAGGTSQCGSYNPGGSSGTGWLITGSSSGSVWSGCHYTCSWASGNANWWGTNGGSGQSSGGAGTINAGPYACTFGGPPGTPAGGGGGTGSDGSGQAGPSSNRIGTFGGNGAWSPIASSTGPRGNDGGGGGGGGAAQASATGHCYFASSGIDTYNGTGGGGGGAGGCGASGGGGGMMGGGSFALVLVNSIFSAQSAVQVTGAQGGAGGNAGAGVAGGSAGSGGANCSCQNAAGQGVPNCSANCGGAGNSGAGGNVGNGGASGGGAGGNGGPSVAIVLVSGGSLPNSPTIYPGSGGSFGSGAAGAGSAPAGTAGQIGLGQATYTVTQ